MMNLKNTLAKRFIQQVLIMISVVCMCSFVFADELIELEVGYEALEEYKTFQLEPGTYVSEDESVASVDENGLVTAVRFGDTVITQYSGDDIIKTIEVIVYLVGDEPVPWGSVIIDKPYISGYPGQKFKPKNFITRAEVATMFVKLMDLDYEVETDYLDVYNTHWAYDYVQSIVESKLMMPRTETEFFPDAFLTKGEFAELLAAYAKHQGFDINQEPKENILDVSFKDGGFVAIHQMLNTKILTLTDGYFYPHDFIRRDEAVNIINKIIDKKHFGVYENTFIDVDEQNPYYQDICNAFY